MNLSHPEPARNGSAEKSQPSPPHGRGIADACPPTDTSVHIFAPKVPPVLKSASDRAIVNDVFVTWGPDAATILRRRLVALARRQATIETTNQSLDQGDSNVP